MYKFLVIFFLAACICLLAEAQLTFTSSWGGKRSMGTMMATMPCRNDEAISNIYKMIQAEAERLLLCQKP
ncbi:Adipokinetic prohormone [Papilio machaon]|nr:Adipokinetic prohormone [Papilio xuthus]KPJ15513.1 Adipokinetic prohormone [Papilio machaon]